tara:strand:+ start:71 stop:343 length:273 start_codon:yes stop_codon:yes gene_type:complete
MNTYRLEELASTISNLNKDHHVEILRLIKQEEPTMAITENTNGSFINMNDLKETTVDKIQTYIQLNEKREEEFIEHENLKNTIIESFIHT